MKRQILSEELFKDKNYEKDNLHQIREAVRDCARRYGLAAVQLFRRSAFRSYSWSMWKKRRMSQQIVIVSICWLAQ